MLINKSFCLADEAKVSVVTYTAKIPKISLGAYIFQRPLLGGPIIRKIVCLVLQSKHSE